MDLGCYGVYSALALLGPDPKKVSYTAMMLETGAASTPFSGSHCQLSLAGVDAGGTLVLDYGDAMVTWPA